MATYIHLDTGHRIDVDVDRSPTKEAFDQTNSLRGTWDCQMVVVPETGGSDVAFPISRLAFVRFVPDQDLTQDHDSAKVQS